MRRTVTYYWHESHAGYADANLTNLPSSVIVLDGSGVEASRTEYVYDAGALTGYGGSILNHDPAFGTSFVMRGNATSTRRYLQEAGRYVASTAAYDIAGNVASTTDAKGNSTSVSYSPAYHYAVQQSVTNALGHVTQYTWSRRAIYEESGQPAGYGPTELASVKDPNNVTVASYAYDYYLSRVTQEQTPEETRNYGYDDFKYLTTASSSSGYRYTTGNPTGESVREEQSDPDPEAENIVQTTSYDLFHRVRSQSLPYRRGGSASSRSYGYDALGRLTSVYRPGAGTVTYQYTGNTALATDPEGRRRKYTYDALARMIKVTEEDTQGNLVVETTYDYDVLDRLRRIVQGDQTRVFVYDSLGRLASETHPESGTTLHGYDDNGNLTSSTDARGLATTYSYDALNRMTATGYSDATPGATFSYDETSSSLIGTITNGKGRRTSAWTSDGTGYSWSYDTAGRVLDQIFKIDAVTYPLHYSYMDTGCGCTRKDLMSMTYPGAFEVNYTRDSIGRVLSISKPNAVYDKDWYLRDVEYEAADGAVSMIRFGNNARDYFYYSYGRPGGLALRYLSSAPSVNWSYQYSPSGRISQINEERLNSSDSRWYLASFTYSYDRLGRLATAVRQYDDSYGNWSTDWSMTYSYDRYDNMLSRQNAPPQGGGSTTTFSVDPFTNRLISYTTYPTTINVGYDASGNMTTRSEKAYDWDGAGRLMRARRPSDGAQYGNDRYDAFGRRIRRSWDYPIGSGPQRSTGSIVYVYGAGGELVAEYRNVTAGPGGAETSTTYNIHMGATMVAKRVTGTFSGQPYERTEWLHRNHLQEVVGKDYSNLSGCTDCSGWTWTYAQPFGSGGSDQFQGHKDDPETYLKYFGARYYDAGGSSAQNAGSLRWMSPDSLTARLHDPQSLNKYAYVRNDPVNLVDPDGRDPQSPWDEYWNGEQWITFVRWDYNPFPHRPPEAVPA
ncbi:MAG: hypothetical protein HXY20_12255 [Acidobacteria bacterium]|nr:hypothetical protein [Acidobacteriota bacterium]